VELNPGDTAKALQEILDAGGKMVMAKRLMSS
jgi:hypothetical protein